MIITMENTEYWKQNLIIFAKCVQTSKIFCGCEEHHRIPGNCSVKIAQCISRLIQTGSWKSRQGDAIGQGVHIAWLCRHHSPSCIYAPHPNQQYLRWRKAVVQRKHLSNFFLTDPALGSTTFCILGSEVFQECVISHLTLKVDRFVTNISSSRVYKPTIQPTLPPFFDPAFPFLAPSTTAPGPWTTKHIHIRKTGKFWTTSLINRYKLILDNVSNLSYSLCYLLLVFPS